VSDVSKTLTFTASLPRLDESSDDYDATVPDFDMDDISVSPTNCGAFDDSSFAQDDTNPNLYTVDFDFAADRIGGPCAITVQAAAFANSGGTENVEQVLSFVYDKVAGKPNPDSITGIAADE
jgi:hypothetical protein